MRIPLDRGKRKGGVKFVKVEGEREEEKEILIRHEMVFPKWKRWSHEKFSRAWNKSYSV